MCAAAKPALVKFPETIPDCAKPGAPRLLYSFNNRLRVTFYWQELFDTKTRQVILSLIREYGAARILEGK